MKIKKSSAVVDLVRVYTGIYRIHGVVAGRRKTEAPIIITFFAGFKQHSSMQWERWKERDGKKEREFENRKIYSWVVRFFLCALRCASEFEEQKCTVTREKKKEKKFEGGEKRISSLPSRSLRCRHPRTINEKRRSCGSERLSRGEWKCRRSIDGYTTPHNTIQQWFLTKLKSRTASVNFQPPLSTKFKILSTLKYWKTSMIYFAHSRSERFCHGFSNYRNTFFFFFWISAILKTDIFPRRVFVKIWRFDYYGKFRGRFRKWDTGTGLYSCWEICNV